MGEYKTPNVYINEKNTVDNSAIEAKTAIPVFIGLTEKAQNGNEYLLNKPVKIKTMSEYFDYFGGAKKYKFNVTVGGTDETAISAEYNGVKLQAKLENEGIYSLYNHILMFFANGGDTCYIVSLGDHNTGKIDKDVISNTILPELKKVEDITLILVPEVANDVSAMGIYQDLLSFCESKKCFAILDIPTKYNAGVEGNTDVERFRNAIGTSNLQYGAAYYPWLYTSVLQYNDIDGMTLFFNPTPGQDKYTGNASLDEYIVTAFAEIEAAQGDGDTQKKLRNFLHKVLLQEWTVYKILVDKVQTFLNLLPPSSAIAGIYNMVDSTRGVWKASANVSINYVNRPATMVTDYEQQDLNMPKDGKAVNAIRMFPGDGIRVWGARTLDGNSNDSRYINVRRTIIFLETSVKNAARAYIFEPNNADTWASVKHMIENFLHSVWKRGGLMGASSEDAYRVHVGLGDTMTPEDIQEGIMRIKVLVAINRPAEFVEINFQQKMDKN
uniref:phage tail sheath family protein n=1 Tax=uncultured Bacteroides sp. TaxID=162156 RepID=UPI0025DD83CD|nr:phage tail sheath C-terminal domain-containing protein [uncultured Bacteroides sp.]